MKKLLCALLAAGALMLLCGCQRPDDLRLDLYQGYGNQRKLLHLNASTGQKSSRMEEFRAVVTDGKPLEKDLSLFAYYPDYLLKINDSLAGSQTAAIIDVNGDYVDYYLCDGDGNPSPPVIYRSAFSAQELKELIHQ